MTIIRAVITLITNIVSNVVDERECVICNALVVHSLQLRCIYTREWITVRMKASSATQTKVTKRKESAIYVTEIFNYHVKEAEQNVKAQSM